MPALTENLAFALYGLALGYVLLHFLVYAVMLRRQPAFRQERTIFRYHLVSACGFALVALTPVALYRDASTLVTAVGLISGHGIYSLSFLELWSLSQGGYSLSILSAVDRHVDFERPTIIQSFAGIGDAKKADRMAGLERLGLIACQAGVWRATGRGRRVATGLRALLWLANVRTRG